MRHFSQILEDHVASRGWSLRSFADRVGISHTVFNKIKKGTIPPTTTRLDGWADALHLEGVEREEFMVAGWLANAPTELARYVAIDTLIVNADRAADTRVPYAVDTIDELRERIQTLEKLLSEIHRLSGDAPK